MTQAAQAYGKTANKTSNPRDLEADLLLQAASQLQNIRDGWESKHTELNAALNNNRKLWTLLVATVTRPENPLPANIRQNVAHIGRYVFKQKTAYAITTSDWSSDVCSSRSRTGIRTAQPRLTPGNIRQKKAAALSAAFLLRAKVDAARLAQAPKPLFYVVDQTGLVHHRRDLHARLQSRL